VVRLAALLSLLLLEGCGIPSAAPPLEPADFVLAGIPLDADSGEIRLSFGEPDSVVQSQNPYDAATPLVAWHYAGLVVRFSGAALPSSYLITGGDEATARGVRVGDAAASVVRRYGEPPFRYEGIWTYTELGSESELYVLEFLVEADTVSRIHVGRASD
jgi:hypothetical protein